MTDEAAPPAVKPKRARAGPISRIAPKTGIRVPEFLTERREVEFFVRVVDDVIPLHLARHSDVGAYGRWAH